jgi:DNA gyrase subunit B
VLPLKGKILNVEKARLERMLSSAEVGTLITALGCGIGRDELKTENLRYHRIIIMTDADVDGAHIRTLLLTFFYRHMYPLVERGHVYIAQPPLYKVKAGKSEAYVKDDRELQNWLIESALDEAVLESAQGELPLPQLRRLAVMHSEVDRLVDLRTRHSDANLWQVLRDHLPVPNDPGALELWRQRYQAALSVLGGSSQSYEVAAQAGDLYPRVTVTRVLHGEASSWVLGEEFFAGGEYRQMMELYQQAKPLETTELKVKRGERSQIVATFSNAYAWLIAEAKRGLHIQRYKGLGEMNPEQLWETTLDPEHRRLVRVHAEDAVAADQIFTTLMGEEVEPRREFIERHALLVGNLDV